MSPERWLWGYGAHGAGMGWGWGPPGYAREPWPPLSDRTGFSPQLAVQAGPERQSSVRLVGGEARSTRQIFTSSAPARPGTGKPLPLGLQRGPGVGKKQRRRVHGSCVQDRPAVALMLVQCNFYADALASTLPQPGPSAPQIWEPSGVAACPRCGCKSALERTETIWRKQADSFPSITPHPARGDHQKPAWVE